MGQAKLRGTKEQRVAKGIAKAQERDRAREARNAARWRNMTPSQRRMQINLAALLALMEPTDRRTPERPE